MREGVVSNLMTLVSDASNQIWICFSVLPDDKKSSRHILITENVEDRGSPTWIWTIIKSKCNQTWTIPSALDDIRRGDRCDVFVRYEASLRIGFKSTRAGLWLGRYDLQ